MVRDIRIFSSLPVNGQLKPPDTLAPAFSCHSGRYHLQGLMIVLVFSLFLSGCQFKSGLLKTADEDRKERGEVLLYTQPFPQESDRLRFNIEEISAVRDDAMVFPLSPVLSEIKCRDMKSQRLLATGWLPPGHYTEVLFKVKNASLEVEDGEANLLVPAGPVTAPFMFDVGREMSYVFSLVFNYTQSIKGMLSFSPSFSVFFPERPVVNLLGYVSNSESDTITVIDKKAMQVINVIATGKGPRGIAIDQVRKRAYVALSGDDSIDVIDITAGRKINTIRLNPGDKPQESALTPAGTLLITANTGSDSISLIDPLAFIELDRIAVGNSPHSIAIDPAGRRAYVFNSLSSTISVIDLASSSVAATISTEPGPLRGQFNREGNKLYVIHEWSSYMTVIDPFTLSALGRVRIGMGANALKLDTRTNLIYVARKNDIMVEVYDPFSAIPIDYIKAEGSASYITIDSEENNLYLIVPEMKTVLVVDIVSKKIVSKIDIGKSPAWVTMMGER